MEDIKGVKKERISVNITSSKMDKSILIGRRKKHGYMVSLLNTKVPCS